MQEPRHKSVTAGCFVLRHGADDHKYLLLDETVIQARELQGMHVNDLGSSRSKGGNGPKNSREFLSHFLYFSIIFILFEKYGKWYENRIECCGNRSGYDCISIPSVFILADKIR
jgi:hypothetical protein